MPALTACKLLPDRISSRIASSDGSSPDVEICHSVGCARRELVTVAVKKEDHAKLKAAGGPHPDHIQMALRQYIDTIRKTGWRPHKTSFGWNRGAVVYVPIAIEKGLADEIRTLPGRFDGHTIEALRLLFNGNGIARQEAVQAHLGLAPSSRLVSGAVALLSLVIERILGQPSIP